jgi:hypothetical protein
MRDPLTFTLKAVRRAFRSLGASGASRPRAPEYFGTGDEGWYHVSGQAVSDLIRERLTAPEPCMVSRIGHTELKTLLRRRLVERGLLRNAWDYVNSREEAFGWDEAIRTEMRIFSGFFPCDDESLVRFCDLYLHGIEQVDVLGSWLRGETQFVDHLEGAQRVPLADLEPFFHRDPWTTALEGRKVLVVHPFEKSVRAQFEKRSVLFRDRRMLPDFELATVRAVQSIAGNEDGFTSWFEALDSMCARIRDTEFDVALIGAGAYGLPLAAFVKSIGRKAVHLGGALQLMFGIRGNRWDARPDYQPLFNEHWTRALPEETPRGHQTVDSNTTYW